MRGMSRQQREEQGLDKQDLASLELTDDVPPPPGDIAEEIDEEFSFANPKAMGTNFDDIRELLADVKCTFFSRSRLSSSWTGLSARRLLK